MEIELINADGIILKTKDKYCSEDIEITPKLQTKTTTANGKVTSDNGYVGLKEVTVNVETAPKLQSKTATPTKSQQSITPDSGYDGLSGVTVNAIPDNYVIPSGTIQITENGVVDVSGKANANVNVPSKEEEAKTVDLAMASGNQTITPTSGKVLSQVVVKKPATLIAGNIKKDVNIGGVTGTLETQKEEEVGTATITENGSQTFSPTSGKVFSDFTVTTNVPTGVDTSDATASYRDILAGKTAYAKGSKITGSIETYAGGYFSYVPAQTKFILKDKLSAPASRIFIELASYTTSGVYFNTKNSEGTTRSIDSIDIDSSSLTFNGYASSLGDLSVVYTWIQLTDVYSGKTYPPNTWIAPTAKNLSAGYSDMAISIDGYNWLKQNADDIQYPVNTTLSHVSKISGDYVSTKTAQVFKFSASSGYALPDTVKVIGAKSVWDKSTGNLTLSDPTGKVTIQITGKAV